MVRVLLHALPIKVGGGVRHLENFLKGMLKFPDIEWTVIINNRYKPAIQHENITYLIYSDSYSSGIRRIYFDNFIVNKLSSRNSYDLLISFANLGPVAAPIRHILFQANARFFCKNIKKYTSFKQRIIFKIQKQLILMACKNSEVITPSNSLKSLLIDAGVKEDNITTIYHAVDKSSLGYFLANKKEKNTGIFTFFYPSHFYNYKGVDILLKALYYLAKKRKRFKVVCTFGPQDAHDDFSYVSSYVSKNDLGEFIEFHGNCKQNEMAKYYNTVDSMIFPSLCESFGFPLVEAKLYCLPSVTADTPINKEISRKASLYYESENPIDLADKMEIMMQLSRDDFRFDDFLSKRDWSCYANDFYNLLSNKADK